MAYSSDSGLEKRDETSEAPNICRVSRSAVKDTWNDGGSAVSLSSDVGGLYVKDVKRALSRNAVAEIVSID